jgi:hypothetical protein
MICHREWSKQQEAGNEFVELASHSPARLFVILQIFADESGTHHPQGDKPGSEVPVIAGYMGWLDDWKTFCPAWKTVLKRYDVPNFHAKDFERRWKHPYDLWSDHKAECFKYALAEIAGRQIPLGGGYDIQEHHRIFPNDKTYPYIYPIQQFFKDLIETLNEHGLTKEKIAITFDTNTGKKWQSAITDTVETCKKAGVKIIEHGYGDDEVILPLQAADMYSYRARELHFEKQKRQAEIRNQTRRIVNVKVDSTVYDVILNRNMRPKIGFNPTITPELSKEISELVPKHAPVRRALMEIPNNYFKIYGKRTKSK